MQAIMWGICIVYRNDSDGIHADQYDLNDVAAAVRVYDENNSNVAN